MRPGRLKGREGGRRAPRHTTKMDYRDFQVRSRLNHQNYQCHFVYLQTAISLRHSDTVDVKFLANGKGVVVALPHQAWVEYQKQTAAPLTDDLAARVAATLLQEALERGDDVELLDLNPTAGRTVELARKLAG